MQNVTENALDLINQGSMLMAKAQYENALEKFQQAQKDSPKYIECYINLGNAYACLDRHDEAMDSFKKALMLDENNASVLFDMGSTLYLKGEIAEAIKYYNKADETGNLTADMYDMIAGLFVEEGDNIQALRYLNRAIKLDPANGEYYLEKAKIFIDQQKPAEALETLHELNQVLPDAYEAYDMLSQIYTIQKDYDNAMGIINKGIQRFPQDVSLAYLKMKVLTQFVKDEEAMAYLATVKANGMYSKRQDDFALLETDIYLRAKDINKAIACLEDAANGDYSNPQLAFVLATIYFRNSQFDKVIRITDEMRKHEDNPFYMASAQFYHAQAMSYSGKKAEAEKEFREITKSLRRMTILNPSFYEAYAYRLLAHKELKEFDEALALAQYMKNLFPDRPDGYIFEYTLYKDMGQPEKAEAAKKEVLSRDPNFVF